MTQRAQCSPIRSGRDTLASVALASAQITRHLHYHFGSICLPDDAAPTFLFPFYCALLLFHSAYYNQPTYVLISCLISECYPQLFLNYVISNFNFLIGSATKRHLNLRGGSFVLIRGVFYDRGYVSGGVAVSHLTMTLYIVHYGTIIMMKGLVGKVILMHCKKGCKITKSIVVNFHFIAFLLFSSRENRDVKKNNYKNERVYLNINQIMCDRGPCT